MKVGIIRCMQTENFCPGTFDFKAIANRTGAFEGVEEEIEIIGFISCGGCPGKNTILRAKNGETGCRYDCPCKLYSKGTPIGYSCPFAKKMKDSLVKALGKKIAILDYTHE